MIDQLTKQGGYEGGGHLLPFRGSNDRLPPAPRNDASRTCKYLDSCHPAAPSKDARCRLLCHLAQLSSHRLVSFRNAKGTENPDMSIDHSIPRTSQASFIQRLRHGAEAARKAAAEDPWEPVLRTLRGKVAADGVERISTNEVFDELEVPMKRRPSSTVRLSRVMRRLGWTNIRARGLSRGSYRDRVRGYAREVPGHPATARRPNRF
jgi:hypothetical protein